MMDYETHIIELQNGNLTLLKARNGFIMCGYLNKDVAEKLGDAACIVRGVSTADDVLKAKIVDCTEKAKQYGIRVGMSGREALEKLR